MKKYTVGLDFGTLSLRCLILDTESGEEASCATYEYAHGVMTEHPTCGKPLPEGYALQHPEDYIEGLGKVIREALGNGGIDPSEIVGVGVDFTASTVMAVTEDATPLCLSDRFKNDPHAYVKLWKHHGAISEAERINLVATERGEEWLSRYGGKLSCEFMLPKIYETMLRSPEVYSATYRFTEAADWIVWRLTGVEAHSVCTAGFKSMWDKRNGYPSKEFFRAVDPMLGDTVLEKLPKNIIDMDKPHGYITEQGARLTGLLPGTPVAPALIDAHSALPTAGISRDGAMLMIIGTSTCHILVSEKESPVNGISGYTLGALYPGYFVYEAGQSAVGDCFDWFVTRCVPPSYYEAAEELGMNIHEYLSWMAERILPSEDSPIALDWWNGCRAPYSDGSLKGMILGLDISTPPESIYRALIESTAFGTRRIIELYREAGIEIRELVAAGGIPKKNRLLTEIYADVIGMPVEVCDTEQSCAFGAALLAATSAGLGDLATLSDKFKVRESRAFVPREDRKNTYDKLYRRYKALSEFVARELE